jgi:hypothetical protein
VYNEGARRCVRGSCNSAILLRCKPNLNNLSGQQMDVLNIQLKRIRLNQSIKFTLKDSTQGAVKFDKNLIKTALRIIFFKPTDLESTLV